MEQKKRTLELLSKVKKEEITLEKAQKELFVLFGVNKSATCKLDRIPSECSIALYTTPEGKCGICGHYC